VFFLSENWLKNELSGKKILDFLATTMIAEFWQVDDTSFAFIILKKQLCPCHYPL